ncbi:MULTISPECIES: low temperature requirement protein A [Streptomyces]|uniref:low temperature requirement protein A n=1 Tax=Streptomyces TaxID=1883 RepID=UPI00163C02DC|nr:MULTISPECIES: low temperature requirement protein A [Streptomyces]MBC2876034.1 low temperature requirement protein A [Streptomyces sp. TYQ1024]UBI38398.1 low temperature requirement protein A [Streptomyces mobaraensis]UKW30982.1 low temperature requirement protein A [Streptomyces sp. TYQ1024]
MSDRPRRRLAAGSGVLRRMTTRGRDEEHRVATPLELFFDLCFVVAVAQAGGQLVHALAEAHVGHGVQGYLMMFFAIWWAWMNFTWFASAYDTDDVLFRGMTLVQIAGVLVFAAGIPRAFDSGDFRVIWSGYLVMRLAMVAQWLRAGLSTAGRERRTALRYAAGVSACQVGWLGLLFLPDGAKPWLFLGMAICEMAVPVWAEHDHQTGWHPHHIAERYGLFTIIVLGETVSAATVAVQSAVDEHQALGTLLPIAAGGLLIIFAAYWIYFAVPIHLHLISNRQAFLWGYGHYLVFGSVAAIGAGIEVAIEEATGKAHVSTFAASGTVTLAVALFMFTVWLIHSRHQKRGLIQQAVLPVSALLVLACTFAGRWAVLLAGAVATATVTVGVTLTARGGTALEEEHGRGGGDGEASRAAG